MSSSRSHSSDQPCQLHHKAAPPVSERPPASILAKRLLAEDVLDPKLVSSSSSSVGLRAISVRHIVGVSLSCICRSVKVRATSLHDQAIFLALPVAPRGVMDYGRRHACPVAWRMSSTASQASDYIQQHRGRRGNSDAAQHLLPCKAHLFPRRILSGHQLVPTHL